MYIFSQYNTLEHMIIWIGLNTEQLSKNKIIVRKNVTKILDYELYQKEDTTISTTFYKLNFWLKRHFYIQITELMEKYLLHNIYLTDKIISIKRLFYLSITNVTYISILEWPANLHLGYARYWTFEITSADLQRRCTETNKVFAHMLPALTLQKLDIFA